MTNHPNRSKAWETLANEAIADAGDWKRQYRELQAINAELLAALKATVKQVQMFAEKAGYLGANDYTAEARAAIAKVEAR